MRDPDRIDVFLKELGVLWKQYCPDLRFMQLIINFQQYSIRDCFYMEDDEFLENFNFYIKLFNKNEDVEE